MTVHVSGQCFAGFQINFKQWMLMSKCSGHYFGAWASLYLSDLLDVIPVEDLLHDSKVNTFMMHPFISN